MPAFRNPKSEIRNPKYVCSPLPAPRSGLSLTEVLIAMGILTLGLLGVAVLFPVGSFYMQKAEIADRGSAIGQAVMSDIVARGMLNPSAWIVMTPSNVGSATNPTSPNYAFRVDGPRGIFSRPFAAALAEGLSLTNDPVTLSRQFGNAYVIDPMAIAAAANPTASSAYNPLTYLFPANVWMVPMSTTYNAPAWAPWMPAAKGESTWPIRRVTFRQPTGIAGPQQLDATMAEHYFRGNDDLATDLPDRDDRPAAQNWDTVMDDNGTPLPLARQWTGDYSWIVTVVPTTNAARDGMARNPESYAYDVSVVVFYKRLLPDAFPGTTTDLAATERVVKARVLSSGLKGGELLLEAQYDGLTESAFEGLRAGQWIMLCGPHPNSNVNISTNPRTGEPRFVMNWYQVMSIEGEQTRLNNQGTETPAPPSGDPERRLIMVRGPQWPWLPTIPTDNNALSNNLCVGICRGAVAVHTKTFRLEGSRSSAATAFGSSGRPNAEDKWWP